MIDAEQRVLSAMLNSEKACIDAIDLLKDADFKDKLNRDIFLLTSDLFIRGIKPTYIEILKEGHTLGLIETSKDANKVKEIATSYIDEENTLYWINKVISHSKGLKMQELLKEYHKKLKSDAETIETIKQAASDFFSLAMDIDISKTDTATELAEFSEKNIKEKIETYRKLKEEQKLVGGVLLEGVPTGFETLNRLTLGYKPGDLIILGAETGHGKTAFALNTALAIAEKHKVFYLNTEMSKKQVSNRLVSILAGVNLNQIRQGSLTNDQWEVVKHKLQDLKEMGFYHKQEPNLTPEKLLTTAQREKMQNNIDVLILDYVGRMETLDPRLQEWQMLYQIIKNAKMMAQNLEIAVIILVQLNPDGTLQGAKKMKNEADLMLKFAPLDEEQLSQLQIKHKKMYEGGTNYRIYVDKARDAQTGDSIPIVFEKNTQLIREAVALRNL